VPFDIYRFTRTVPHVRHSRAAPNVLVTGVFIAFFGMLQSVMAEFRVPAPPVSDDQYQRILALHPDRKKPVYVTLKIHRMSGGITGVDVIESSGLTDVDRKVAAWAWNNYAYSKSPESTTIEKVRVDSPVLRDPPMNLTTRTYLRLKNASKLQNRTLAVLLEITVSNGRITKVTTKRSSGYDFLDRDCEKYVLKQWRFRNGVNGRFNLPLQIFL
jgi:hypothetical protein